VRRRGDALRDEEVGSKLAGARSAATGGRLRVALMALNAAGVSGVPRYTSVLARAVDGVAEEFPSLELVLVTTRAGAEAIEPRRVPVRIVRPLRLDLYRGALRLLAEQLAVPAVDSELVHFFDVYAPLLAPRRPFITTFHDASISYPGLARFGRAQRAYKRRLYPWALTRAAAIVAVSDFAKQEAVQRFAVDPAKVVVVRSGPGLAPNLGHGDRPNGRPNGRPYFLFVGNLTARKNVPFLIRAYERTNVEADLVLAGSPRDDTGAIMAAVAQSPKRDRIRVVAAPDDAAVDRLYREALGLLHPARYEGFGFTPLEAMSRGCPVIASDIPAIREIAGPGALLLPFEEGLWADAIGRLEQEQALQEELRARGRATAAGYSWTKAARQLCNLFLRTGPSTD
jgi:glycosyltransferase involved in cell wall biosynthesis